MSACNSVFLTHQERLSIMVLHKGDFKGSSESDGEARAPCLPMRHQELECHK